MNEQQLTSWKLYYILDSLKYNPDLITLYPGLSIDEITDIINFLKISNYIDSDSQLTKSGEIRLKDLSRELKLNRYNKHIYPRFNDLFTN